MHVAEMKGYKLGKKLAELASVVEHLVAGGLVYTPAAKDVHKLVNGKLHTNAGHPDTGGFSYLPYNNLFRGPDFYELLKVADKEVTIKQSELDELKAKLAELETRGL